MKREEIESIKQKLDERFQVSRQVAESITLCERQYGNSKPVAVYFFDYGDHEMSTLSLSDYQDQYIAPQYYSRDDYVQWNYYVVFLLSDRKYRQAMESDAIRTIREDTVYARKYVLSVNDLSQFLKFSIVSSELTKLAVSEGLSSEWIQVLEQNNLQSVYGDQKIKDIVEEIARSSKTGNSNLIPTNEPFRNQIGQLPAPTFLSKLKISKFRKYPPPGEYEFSRVNLIAGPNGVGKTSLLEAMELCFCDGTLRNESKHFENVDIEYLHRGESEYTKYVPKNKKLQAERNLSWYGIQNPPIKNLLPESFSKFNFFNSDAAFAIAHEKSLVKINDAFGALALGRDLIYIDNRLRKLYDEIKNRVRGIDKECALLEKLIGEQKEKLVTFALIGKNLKGVQSIVEDHYRSIDFIDRSVWNIENFNIRDQLFELHSKANSIRQYEDWFPIPSIEKIEDAKRKCESDLQAISDMIMGLETDKRKLAQLIDSEQSISARITEINRASSYAKEMGIEKIESIHEEIHGFQAEIEELSSIVELLSNWDLPTLRDFAKEDLTIAVERNSERQNELSVLLDRKEVEVLEIRDKANQLATIIAGIKQLGRDYLEHQPDASICPLCETELNAKTLTERVANTHEDIPGAQSIVNLEKELLELSGEITTRSLLEDVLAESRKFGPKLAKHALPELKNVGNVIELPLNLKRLIIQKERTLQPLERLLEQFNRKELTSEEYKELTIQFPDVFIQETDVEKRTKKITSIRDSLLERKKQVDSETQRWSAKLSDAELSLKSAFAPYHEPERTQLNIDKKSILEARLSKLERLADSAHHLAEHIQISKTQDLLVVADSISSLYEKFLELQDTFASLTETDVQIEHVKNDKKKNESRLATSEEQKSNLEQAKKVIEYILEEKSKEKALEDFVNIHRDSINRIFSKIHYPPEFIGLDESRFALRRVGPDNLAFMNEISTGQRSALALSIFIALNLSLKDGPPILLIDDPVAYVDDLNILSFLDYLRDIVIEFDRQLFLATANEKLESLFKKKFAFLGTEELTTIRLSR